MCIHVIYACVLLVVLLLSHVNVHLGFDRGSLAYIAEIFLLSLEVSLLLPENC